MGLPFLSSFVPTLAAAISRGVEFLLIPLLCKFVSVSLYFILCSCEVNKGLPVESTATPTAFAVSRRYSSLVNLFESVLDLDDVVGLLDIAGFVCAFFLLVACVETFATVPFLEPVAGEEVVIFLEEVTLGVFAVLALLFTDVFVADTSFFVLLVTVVLGAVVGLAVLFTDVFVAETGFLVLLVTVALGAVVGLAILFAVVLVVGAGFFALLVVVLAVFPE